MDVADAKGSAGWSDLLKVVTPVLITSMVTYLVARMQSQASVELARAEARSAKDATDLNAKRLHESDQRIDASEEKIQELVLKMNDFKRLRKVVGEFRNPKANNPVDPSIPCEGSFENLSPDFHLWVAVEIDGFIYFKEPEVKLLTREGGKGTWSTTITEPARSDGPKVFNLRLYAATEEGHYQIENWLRSGKFEKIPWMSNTRMLEHVDGIHLSAKSK